MKKQINYCVRVLTLDCKNLWIENLSYDDAVERFLFYVHLALESGLSVRCVNIFCGNRKKSIKLFENH